MTLPLLSTRLADSPILAAGVESTQSGSAARSGCEIKHDTAG
jgi:hypothetical protein